MNRDFKKKVQHSRIALVTLPFSYQTNEPDGSKEWETISEETDEEYNQIIISV